MKIMDITSRQNQRFKSVLALKSKKGRRDQCRYIAEGHKLLTELAFEPELLLELWISDRVEEDTIGQYWLEFAQKNDVSVFRVEDQLFKELVDTVTTQGVIGVIRIKTYGLERFFEQVPCRGVLPDGVQDPGNLGTIIRTAEAMGFDFVLVPSGTTDPYNEKCVRASMGSIFHIPIILTDQIEVDMEMLKSNDYQIVGAALESSTEIFYTQFDERLLLAIGSETKGLTKKVVKAVECTVKIPMQGHVESLNAAIAMSIIAYEIRRQALVNNP